MAQVNWDSVNTISFQEVAGTTMHLLEFRDNNGFAHLYFGLSVAGIGDVD